VALNKVYRYIKLPSWCKTAERETLLEHMQYLTHEKNKYKRLYDKKLREIRKLKEEIKRMEVASDIIGESFLDMDK
jgi:hypothetical protein